MKFAKIVFRIAAVWGVIALAPLYFLYDSIGRLTPPAVTHPEFFYGFVAVALVWQVVFFVIGLDPVRYRTMMIPALLEKFGYISTLVVLYLQNRITSAQALPAIPDGLLGVLFTVAYFRAR